MSIQKAIGVTNQGKRSCRTCHLENGTVIAFMAKEINIGFCEYCPDDDYFDVWALVKEFLEDAECELEISNGIVYVSTPDGEVWDFTVPKIRRLGK